MENTWLEQDISDYDRTDVSMAHSLGKLVHNRKGAENVLGQTHDGIQTESQLMAADIHNP